MTKHSEATNTKLIVRQALEQPIVYEAWQAELDRKKAGPRYKGNAKKLETVILGMSQLQLEEYKKKLEEKGQVEFNVAGKTEPLVVDKELLRIERVTKKETSRTFIRRC